MNEADAAGEELAAQAATIAVRLRRSAPQRFTLLIDGRSGSGKTTLAALLAETFRVPLVRLDDSYPGWDGLGEAGRSLHDLLLQPRSTGAPAGWRRWDWQADAPAEWHSVPGDRSLVVEGSGSLTRANRALVDFAVWLELDAPTRKARALARDGDAYAPHWDRWARQERSHFLAERPDLLADLIVAG